MRTIRVLVLDTPASYLDRVSKEYGVQLQVTQISNEDIWSDTLNFGMGGYRASVRAQNLARSAHPDDYDYVIIGNNMGQGFIFARLICEELRPKTLIVFNPSSSRSEVPDYKRLGFSHFASRHEQGQWILEQIGLNRAV
ncbi:MAG: hypothetical protein QG675_603 [Patescibacteria group bacterium]|nr:hypothetical protein [Patescibacteria group bacterium]